MEKENNATTTLCDKHESYSLKGVSRNDPEKYKKTLEEFFTPNKLNLDTKEYICHLEHNKYKLQHKKDSSLTVDIGINNNEEHEVKQQHNNIDTMNTRLSIPSHKLNHNNMVELPNRRIESTDTQTSNSIPHLDHNIVDQENKQQRKRDSKINKDCTYAINNYSMENKIVIIQSTSTLNNVDNVNKQLRIKLRSKSIEPTRETYPSSSHKVDTTTIINYFKRINIRHASKNMKASDSCNIYVNDMKKQENMQLQRRRKHESINKKDSMTKNTVDNDMIQHNSCSIPKKYITEDTLSLTTNDL